MKDYDKLIIWLDYFDSSVPRSRGRRIPNHSATKSPTLNELKAAAQKLGLEPEVFESRRPSSRRITGYIQVKKIMKKGELIKKLANQLSAVRSEVRKASEKR
jgi:Signal recognition particle 19 kDa protein